MTKCYIQLGKTGDIILMLPAWRKVYLETGMKPVVMVSDKFASVLEGVSYVAPWVVDLDFFKDCDRARALAQSQFEQERVVFPKWWDDPSYNPPIPQGTEQILTVRNKKFPMPKSGWFSYMESQWTHAGFSMDDFQDPVIFDQRDAARELELRRNFFISEKPKLLLSFSEKTSSSPFVYEQLVRESISRWSDRFELVDIGLIRAERIYDLLGLYDHAACLLSTDTATLHLASASWIPTIALIQNGGGGSIPRGNCYQVIRYSDAPFKLNLINQTIANCFERSKVPQ